MKELYVDGVLYRTSVGTEVDLYGWIKNRRDHGNVIFLDICDSTGWMQVVVDKSRFSEEQFNLISKLTVESSVLVKGKLALTGKKTPTRNLEIRAESVELIGAANLGLTPSPRGNSFDIFDERLQDHLLTNRHFYLRNEKIMAILKFRHHLMGLVHEWFRADGFIEITAPILTPTPLYEGRSAIGLELYDEDIFLTQCVGFYLESAVHAFERVYNIGPSFRGEEGRSKRHLTEYHHIKAELAFGDLEDIITLVENLISFVTQRCSGEARIADLATVVGRPLCLDGLTPPFPRLSYCEAVTILQQRGVDFEFGKSLGSDEEAMLSENFSQPFWVVGIPRTIEPFPYVIDSVDPRLTRTADLIATNGYGELLGVAEKIHDPAMLDERMAEKGKSDPLYQWLRDMRQFGCVPHIGFGLGVERFIRWLMNIPHVRDTIPFPRTFGRKVRP
jgi:asparaginyl-tRNA synthetase